MTNDMTLPTDQHYSYDALDLADLADSTKIKYRRAWERAIKAGVNLMDPDEVIAYALKQPPSGRLHLSAMMKIQTEAAIRKLKLNIDPATITPETVAILQAIFWKLEALQSAIPTQTEKGKKAHIWLTQEQVNEITALPFQVPGKQIRAMRNYIVLATLLGAGLRREEMHEVTFDALKRIPVEGKVKDVLQITGKGETSRVIIISPLLAQHLREWQSIVGGGRIARAINKADKINSELSEDGIFDIVREFGALIGLPQLDPHDCRRSYGRLIYEETKDIKLVRDLLGHKDVKTTMRYIGLDLNLNVDPTNFVIRRSEVFMPVSGD